MINFSGTSYLGLNRHPQMIEWISNGLRLYGSHYGGSRRSGIAPDIYQQAENKMAKWTGAPAALLVSSGTAAAQLVNKYLENKERPLYYSPNTHPTLWQMNGLQTKTWEEWNKKLQKEKIVALTDATNPLFVNMTNWDALPQGSKEALLIVDDAHYLGIGGENGAGHWRILRQKWKGELIITSSLGKALAMPAGLILASEDIIMELTNLPQFGGASPPPPAYIHAFMQAEELIKQQQLKLKQNIKTTHNTLNALEGYTLLPNYPVIGLADHSLAGQLAKKGIIISSFRYPSPKAPIYSRIILHADHSNRQLEKLLSALLS